MKNVIIAIVMVFLAGIVGCTEQAPAPVEQPEPEIEAEPIEEEEEEVIPEEPEEIVVELPEEIQALFDKAVDKTNNIKFDYNGPETDGQVYTIYVQDNLHRYVPGKTYKDPQIDDDAYNAIYVDTVEKTANAHCDIHLCVKKGKKRSISYNDAVILSPLEWVEQITEAEKTGEEKVEQRNAWKLDTNIGTVHVDSFYGIIMQIESGEDVYKFMRLEPNVVTDEDLRP